MEEFLLVLNDNIMIVFLLIAAFCSMLGFVVPPPRHLLSVKTAQSNEAPSAERPAETSPASQQLTLADEGRASAAECGSATI